MPRGGVSLLPDLTPLPSLYSKARLRAPGITGYGDDPTEVRSSVPPPSLLLLLAPAPPPGPRPPLGPSELGTPAAPAPPEAPPVAAHGPPWRRLRGPGPRGALQLSRVNPRAPHPSAPPRAPKVLVLVRRRPPRPSLAAPEAWALVPLAPLLAPRGAHVGGPVAMAHVPPRPPGARGAGGEGGVGRECRPLALRGDRSARKTRKTLWKLWPKFGPKFEAFGP